MARVIVGAMAVAGLPVLSALIAPTASALELTPEGVLVSSGEVVTVTASSRGSLEGHVYVYGDGWTQWIASNVGSGGEWYSQPAEIPAGPVNVEVQSFWGDSWNTVDHEQHFLIGQDPFGAPVVYFEEVLRDGDLDYDDVEVSFGGAGQPDTDGDGVLDTADNCPAAANVDQANFDGDAQGDACDADDDNDGVGDADDLFGSSNSSPTVSIGGIQLPVANEPTGDGGTINDHLSAAVASSTTSGQLSSKVTSLTNTWKSDGLISGTEKGAIQSAVAKVKLPKR